MKTLCATDRGRNGSPRATSGTALVTVMVVIVTVAAILGGVMIAALQRPYTVKRLANYTRAQAIAEAGANQAYSVLKTNFAARTNAAAFPPTLYGGGGIDTNAGYDVEVVPVSNNMAVITCTGTFADAQSVVMLDIRNYGSSDTNQMSTNAFGYAIVAAGTMDWNGGGTFSGGAKVHCNSAFSLGGNGTVNANVSSSVSISVSGSAELNGDATAPSISGSSKITGTETEQAVPTVDIPQINLDPYAAVALVYNGDLTISSSSQPEANPPNGVLWVNGTLTINPGVTAVGCFIATGDVDCKGTQTKYAGYPALVSKTGDITIESQANIHGLVYAPNSFVKFTGGGLLTGSIICGGYLQKAGGSCAVSYENSIPVPPGGTTGDDIGVSAWQK